MRKTMLFTHGAHAAVEVWSGNHPFYQGKTATMVRDEGPLARFRRRYSGLVAYNEIPGGEMRVGATAAPGESDEEEEEEPEEPQSRSGAPITRGGKGSAKPQKPKKKKGK